MKPTTVWHGYPQAEGAHPERPWWRAIWGPWPNVAPRQNYALRWMRGDDFECLVVNEDHIRMQMYEHTCHPDITALLAAHDAEHPLPTPPPLVGQVWAGVKRLYGGGPMEAEEVMIAWINQEKVAIANYGYTWPRHAWPPPGAMLVYGPGAPWAPPEAP